MLLLVAMGWAAAAERVGGLRRGEVHAFFYLWYGTPEVDGHYMHWDHEVLPHWEERINERFRGTLLINSPTTKQAGRQAGKRHPFANMQSNLS